MLTVWCVWWRDPAAPDKYSAYHVQRMQREVKKHLSLPHRFICITDQKADRVITMPPLVGWPGWWQKIQLFRPGVATTTNLYIDLDCVVTGSLDELVTRYGQCDLAAPNNWAASGHNSVQSSVMVWKQSKHTLPIYRDFRPEWAHWPPVNAPGVLWGDQEHITALRDTGKVDVTPMFPPLVRSYKYHLRGKGLSHDCRVACFHGDPKPDSPEVAAEAKAWLQW
jgi:hypothetical protein